MAIQKICKYCDNRFVSLRNDRKYCCLHCAAKDRPPPPPNSGQFQPGIIPWSKGKTGDQSPLKGSKMTENARRLLSERMRGENCPFWKGGVSNENEKFRKSMEYKDWRKSVFVRDDYTCQFCGRRSKAGGRVELHADHIKPFALYPELRIDLANGRTLCKECHKNTPTYGNGSKTKQYEVGEPSILLDDTLSE